MANQSSPNWEIPLHEGKPPGKGSSVGGVGARDAYCRNVLLPAPRLQRARQYQLQKGTGLYPIPILYLFDIRMNENMNEETLCRCVYVRGASGSSQQRHMEA